MADPVARSRSTPDHPLTRLWRHARGHHRRLLLAAALSVANKLFDLAPPFLIGAAVDVVVSSETSWVGAVFGMSEAMPQLTVLVLVSAVIWGLESLTQYGMSLAWRNLAQAVQHDLRLDAYTRVQELDLGYFSEQSTGELLSVLNDDVNQLERFLDTGANVILQTAVTVVTIGGVYLAVVPRIAITAFLPMPFIIAGSMWFQRLLEPRYAAVRAQVGHLNTLLANNLGGIATIKAFSAQDRERDRVTRESQRYRDVNAEAIRLSSAFVPLIRIGIFTGFAAIMWLGGRQALTGGLGVGTYSVLIFLTQRLLWPLTRLGEVFDNYQRAMASVRRLLDLVGLRPRLRSGDVPLVVPASGTAGVALEGVRFAYEPGQPVLRGVDIEVPPGETHAIVGATGAGKSTIAKLVLRLYDADAGRVVVAGHDVRELTIASLRRAIGLVSQDVFLFHGTVRDNIAYGRPSAGDDEVWEVAALAEADEFIASLPRGLDTIVGERGQKLSGGQRQRLSIARALLIDPAILVLDEATSAVDNETEAAIQRSIERVSASRTTLVIAHRLSTIRRADRIHVLRDGRVAESGTHDELVDLDGLYAGLWRVQTGEAART